jgi:hypothetical protein
MEKYNIAFNRKNKFKFTNLKTLFHKHTLYESMYYVKKTE